jgi:hypothetical protein
MYATLDGRATSLNEEPLPGETVTMLRRLFPPRSVAYIARVLTAGELSVIADPADSLIIARIKRMSDRRLRKLERLGPTRPEDRHLYAALQLEWLRDEQYFLFTRLGRGPTHRELFADFMRNHNGLRFRAYFAMKFPHRVGPLTQTKALKTSSSADASEQGAILSGCASSAPAASYC